MGVVLGTQNLFNSIIPEGRFSSFFPTPLREAFRRRPRRDFGWFLGGFGIDFGRFLASLLEVFGIIFEKLEKTKHVKIDMKIKRTNQNIEAHPYFKRMNLRLRKMSFAPTDRRPARKSRGGPGGRHAPPVKPRAIRATIKKSVG